MNEELLQAYVDNALTPEQRREVEAALAADPQLAERVRAYAAQNVALHALFDPVLDEKHSLQVARAVDPPKRWLAYAALVAAGIAIGFVVRGWIALPEARPTIARQAALAHVAYVPEIRHPIEVAANEEQHLVAWLSKRLSAPLRAPDLSASGYALLGGRLLPAANRDDPAPVALLMYESPQGKRLSLLVKREARNEATSFRYALDGSTHVFYWIDGPFGYALAGDVAKEELQRIARAVYQQLNP
jgi:anti-sigma factor RsiW